MRFRTLRIAWSMLWGLACVLLIALWVRSYSFTDATEKLRILSKQGRLYFHQNFAYTYKPTGLLLPAAWTPRRFLGVYTLTGPPGMQVVPHGEGFVIAYWCLALPMPVLVVVPWVRWRFKVRTLLIATMLVAVVLGFVVYATTK